MIVLFVTSGTTSGTASGTTNVQDFINIIFQYIWAPVLVAVIIWFLKKVIWCIKKISNSHLYVKEIKNLIDPDIAGFKELYEGRIKDCMRIEVEEILKFIGYSDNNDVEHHLLICKRAEKVVGFIKFIISETNKCLFIAYLVVDNKDKIANARGVDKMLSSILKKYVNSHEINVVAEIEQNEDGNYNTPLAKRIARYAKSYKREVFYIDFPYIQPYMPCDNNISITEETFMSLIYIPYYKMKNKTITKEEVIRLISFIYFEIYSPCCNDLKCDCGSYNDHLNYLINVYESEDHNVVDMIKLGGLE